MAQTIIAPQWGTAGQQGIPGADEIARQRQLAAVMASRGGYARNVGEGLTAIGAALGGALANRRAESMDAQRNQALMQAMGAYGNQPETLAQFAIAAQSPLLYQYATQQQAWQRQDAQAKSDAQAALEKERRDRLATAPKYETDDAGRMWKIAPVEGPNGIEMARKPIDPQTGQELQAPTPDKQGKTYQGQVQGITKDVQTLKPVQEAQAATLAWNGMIEAFNQGSGMGDRALVVSFAKLLDPTSVVREGEAAAINSAGSIPDTIKTELRRVLEGTSETLGTKTRNDLMLMAQGLVGQREKTTEQMLTPYKTRAGELGADWNTIYTAPQAAPWNISQKQDFGGPMSATTMRPDPATASGPGITVAPQNMAPAAVMGAKSVGRMINGKQYELVNGQWMEVTP